MRPGETKQKEIQKIHTAVWILADFSFFFRRPVTVCYIWFPSPLRRDPLEGARKPDFFFFIVV